MRVSMGLTHYSIEFQAILLTAYIQNNKNINTKRLRVIRKNNVKHKTPKYSNLLKKFGAEIMCACGALLAVM